MRTTTTDLKATADTYIAVRARLIPAETADGSHLFLHYAPASAQSVTSIRRTGGSLGSGQHIVLMLQGTKHDAWLQMAAAIATMSDVIDGQRRHYPRTNAAGATVWACCESAIGPVCQHRLVDPERSRELVRIGSAAITEVGNL